MERAGSGGKLCGPSHGKLKLGYTTTPQTPTDGGWCCILASLSGNRLQETLNPKLVACRPRATARQATLARACTASG